MTTSYHPYVVEDAKLFALFWLCNDISVTVKGQVEHEHTVNEIHSLQVTATQRPLTKDMFSNLHWESESCISLDILDAITEMPAPEPVTFEIALPEDVSLKNKLGKVDSDGKYGFVFARTPKQKKKEFSYY